jgi:hypothetical protein
MSKIRLLSSGLLLAGSLFILSPAYAVDVSYFTTGTFSGGSTPGTNTYTSATGNLTVTYTGVAALTGLNGPNVTVGPDNPSNASFGQFQVTGSGNITGTFALNVTQVVPGTAAPESFVSDSAAIGGDITTGNSKAVIRFLTAGVGGGGVSVSELDPLSFNPAQKFTLNGVEYWIDQTTKLNPQNTLGGLSSIDGTIDSTTPEPGFYALTGMGLAGVFAVVRRRKNQIQA